MALQGAGDPRWVVRERQDGRNVNAWHWEDKDVSAWAKQRIKQLLSSDSCFTACAGGRVMVELVSSVDGDATLYNRKGVLKVLYDLKVSGTWTGPGAENARTKGTFKFELFDEDPEVQVSVDEKSGKDPQIRALFSQKVVPIVCDQCRVFIRELHAGAGQNLDGLTMPKKKAENESKVTDFLRSGMEQKAVPSVKPVIGVLKMTDVFTCSARDLFLALTDRARLEAITRAKVVSEAVVDGRLDLLNGSAAGKYVKIEQDSGIVMEWKHKSWGDFAAGRAVLKLTEEEGKTEIEISISDVPNEHRTETEGFWRVQILQAMKIVMGWGNASRFL